MLNFGFWLTLSKQMRYICSTINKQMNAKTEIKIKRRVPAYSGTKRADVYAALLKLEVGDGIEVPIETANTTYQACYYAAKNYDRFAGYKFRRMTHGDFVTIKRIA